MAWLEFRYFGIQKITEKFRYFGNIDIRILIFQPGFCSCCVPIDVVDDHTLSCWALSDRAGHHAAVNFVLQRAFVLSRWAEAEIFDLTASPTCRDSRISGSRAMLPSFIQFRHQHTSVLSIPSLRDNFRVFSCCARDVRQDRPRSSLTYLSSWTLWRSRNLNRRAMNDPPSRPRESLCAAKELYLYN